MSSASTLSVHESLSRAGFEVWTPIENKIGRMPRTRTRYEMRSALMPSYVCAHVRHIDDLAGIAMAPQKDHPRFSMFRYQGGFPLIADVELEALRYIEEKRRGIFAKLARKGQKGPTFNHGQQVRVPEGGFAGLSGVVEESHGQFTLVSFAGFHQPIKIASIHLQPCVASDSQPDDGEAARAA